jgi:hypothetical protein
MCLTVLRTSEYGVWRGTQKATIVFRKAAPAMLREEREFFASFSQFLSLRKRTFYLAIFCFVTCYYFIILICYEASARVRYFWFVSLMKLQKY